MPKYFYGFLAAYRDATPAEDPAHQILFFRDSIGWTMPRGRLQAWCGGGGGLLFKKADPFINLDRVVFKALHYISSYNPAHDLQGIRTH